MNSSSAKSRVESVRPWRRISDSRLSQINILGTAASGENNLKQPQLITNHLMRHTPIRMRAVPCCRTSMRMPTTVFVRRFRAPILCTGDHPLLSNPPTNYHHHRYHHPPIPPPTDTTTHRYHPPVPPPPLLHQTKPHLTKPPPTPPSTPP